MNEWEEINGQENASANENGSYPISGSDAVEEAMKKQQEEEARRQQALAAEQARQLAAEHRMAEERERAQQRALWEDYNRQKKAAEKARRAVKRRSLVGVLAMVLAVIALIGAGASFLEMRQLRREIGSLEAQTPGSYAVPGKNTAVSATLTGTESVVAPLESRDALNGSLTDVSDIVEEAIRSVVSVEVVTTVKVTSPFYGTREYESSGAGSGVIIGDSGTELWIATNYHVIENAKSVTVIFCDSEKVEAYVKGSSEEDDLAVLGIAMSSMKPETLNEIRTAVIGSSDTLRLGEGVIAIGNALGWGQSVTTGVVSCLEREVTFDDGNLTMTLLQISAAINPGNSGGALLNAKGELIGINNAKYADESVEGIGFAIPISSILDIMEELSLKEPRVPVAEADYPYLGITFKNMSAAEMKEYGFPVGAYVYEVGKDTPAEKAGIRAYDIITAVNGEKIRNYDDLTNELKYLSGGQTVTLTLMRMSEGVYEEKTLTVTLGYRKDYVK